MVDEVKLDGISDVKHFENSLTFMIRYSRGKNWVEGKSVMEQDLMEHGKYMETALNKGTLLLGGPLLSTEGGLVILHNVNKKDVVEFIENDPGVTNGVFKAEFEEWFVAFKGLKLIENDTI